MTIFSTYATLGCLYKQLHFLTVNTQHLNNDQMVFKSTKWINLWPVKVNGQCVQMFPCLFLYCTVSWLRWFCCCFDELKPFKTNWKKGYFLYTDILYDLLWSWMYFMQITQYSQNSISNHSINDPHSVHHWIFCITPLSSWVTFYRGLIWRWLIQPFISIRSVAQALFRLQCLLSRGF